MDVSSHEVRQVFEEGSVMIASSLLIRVSVFVGLHATLLIWIFAFL